MTRFVLHRPAPYACVPMSRSQGYNIIKDGEQACARVGEVGDARAFAT
jgi:hypothetical protein